MTRIRFHDSRDLGFDLDTKRPLFQNTATSRLYADTALHRMSYDTENWNRIGDPMIIPMNLAYAALTDVGSIIHDNVAYWFRITDFEVLGNNFVRVNYDVDYLASFPEAVGPGRITAIPHRDARALAPATTPRWWQVVNTHRIDGEPWAMVIVTQMTIDDELKQGPYYIMAKPQWTLPSGSNPNPVQSLVDAGIIAAGDVVQAWAVPGFDVFLIPTVDPTQHWALWNTWTGTIPHIEAMKYTDNPLLTSIDAQVPVGEVTGISSGVNLERVDPYEGVQLGMCDDRGVILWTMPYARTLKSTVHIGLRVSFANCEIDVTFVDGTAELEEELVTLRSHVTDRMLTYSCRPLDAVVDAWQDYLFRQREADIENRRIQNESNLVGGVTGIATGAATGALLGSVVPGIGTAVGAVAGAVTGIATTVTGYGVGTHYGAQEQGVTDRIYKLAQDGVSVGGMISSHGMEHGFLHLFAIRTDALTTDSVQAMADLRGFPCDSWSADIRADMTALTSSTAWTPFAAECEVVVPMPASWRRSLQRTLASGARYRKFGVWS